MSNKERIDLIEQRLNVIEKQLNIVPNISNTLILEKFLNSEFFNTKGSWKTEYDQSGGNIVYSTDNTRLMLGLGYNENEDTCIDYPWSIAITLYKGIFPLSFGCGETEYLDCGNFSEKDIYTTLHTIFEEYSIPLDLHCVDEYRKIMYKD